MNGNLISTLWPSAVSRPATQLLLVVTGVALLAAAAHLKVPFWPVPMTMQTFVVLLIGAGYGARLGSATLLSYLAIGAVGLPVFASGAGPAYMMGPTGGYLAGYLVAATLVGWLADQGYGRSILTAVLVFLAGEVAIFALGVGWLSILIGPEKAIAGGLTPFIPAEILKMALAAAVLAATRAKAT